MSQVQWEWLSCYPPQLWLVEVTYLQLLVQISPDRFRWMINGPAWPLAWILAHEACGHQEPHENFKTGKPWNIDLAFLLMIPVYTWPSCPCPRTKKDAFLFYTWTETFIYRNQIPLSPPIQEALEEFPETRKNVTWFTRFIAQCSVSQSLASPYQPPSQAFAGQLPAQPMLPPPQWKRGYEKNLMYACASIQYGIEKQVQLNPGVGKYSQAS